MMNITFLKRQVEFWYTRPLILELLKLLRVILPTSLHSVGHIFHSFEITWLDFLHSVT